MKESFAFLGRARSRLAPHRLPLACFALITALYVHRWNPGNPPGGDGFYTWIFARSMAFDGDLDLTNDYRLCGDPWRLGIDQGGGRPANPFYFGPALIWAPALRLARALHALPADASPSWRAGCTGPWVDGVAWLGPACAVLTLLFGYLLARRLVRQGPACAALLAAAFGSGLVVFPFWWCYSHVWAAGALALAFYLFRRAYDGDEQALTPWLLTGAGIGFASLMRPQHAIWMFAPGLVLLVRLRRQVLARRLWHRPVLQAAMTLLGFCAVFWVQLYVYKLLYGQYLKIPQGTIYLQWLHPHPFLLLFSARSGFVTYTPLMALMCLGLVPLAIDPKTRLFGFSLGVPVMLEIYIAATPVWWTGASTVGARLLVSLSGVLIPAGAALFQRSAEIAARHREKAAPVLVTALLTLPLLIGWGMVHGDGPYQAPSIYADALSVALKDIYKYVGNPLTLPAGLVFRLRYGLPPPVFDALASDGIYWRDTGTGAPAGDGTADFRRLTPYCYSDDLTPVGLHVPAGGSARFLCMLAWPHVTRVRVRGTPSGGGTATLEARGRGFLLGAALPAMTFSGEASTAEVHVSSIAFDSGINEIVLRADKDIDIQTWEWIDDGQYDTGLVQSVYKKRH